MQALARPALTRAALPAQRRSAPLARAAAPQPLRAAAVRLAAAATPLLLAAPALAEAVDEDKGVLFDFNATLPVMGTEFLLLMTLLDNLLFKPVGELLDKRDAEVRGKLSSIGDNSAEIEQLQTDAEAVIAGARNEVAAAMAAQKAATSAEIEKELEETRAKFERELKTAMAALAKEEAELMAQSEESVGDLSKAIVAKVLA